MKTDVTLHPLLVKAFEHFKGLKREDLATTLHTLAASAKLRVLNREEIEKISLIFAPKGPWESTNGHPDLAIALARLLAN